MKNLCTPKVNRKSKERLRLFLSDEDYRKIRRGRWEATVIDTNTMKQYVLAGCSCGTPRCMCDAYVVDTLN